MNRTFNATLDRLKILLSCMVVAIHCGFLGGSENLLGYVVDGGLFRIAVPIFFLISGYFLFNLLSRNSSEITVWARRVFGLYVFWMLVYSPFYIDTTALSTVSGLVGVVKNIIFGFFHLWYLVGMFWAGLLIYIFRERSSNILFALAITMYLIGCMLQYARAYYEIPLGLIQHINENDYVARNFIFFAFPYMVFGYLIARTKLEFKLSLSNLWALLVVGCLFLILESGANFLFQQGAQKIFYFDCLISTLIAAPAIFMLACRLFSPGASTVLAKTSAAIYFVHPLFLAGLLAVGLTEGNAMTALALSGAVLASCMLVPLNKRFSFIL